FGSFACRANSSRPSRLSQHALGQAIDISGFRLSDGSRVSVERDWSDSGARGIFLHRLASKACRYFSVVLTPQSNADHYNHFHFDCGPARFWGPWPGLPADPDALTIPYQSGRTAMTVRLGGGEWSFEVHENWAKVPDEIVLGDCAAVGVDSKDNVYAFNRGEHPIAVFANDGKLLRTWGEGIFTRPHCEPHGVHVAPDDTIWLTDDGDHTVRHCTLDGRVLMTLGIPGKPSPFMSGEPFHHCTHTALSPSGDYLYISDGYGNARIHKYTVDGKLLRSWGEPGTDPGQFNIPHNICCDPEGWIYVADRENHRVQVFDANGKWETQWNYLHRPNGMCLGRGHNLLCYIGESGPQGES